MLVRVGIWLGVVTGWGRCRRIQRSVSSGAKIKGGPSKPGDVTFTYGIGMGEERLSAASGASKQVSTPSIHLVRHSMREARLRVAQLHNFATDPTFVDATLHEIADVEAEGGIALVRADHLANVSTAVDMSEDSLWVAVPLC